MSRIVQFIRNGYKDVVVTFDREYGQDMKEERFIPIMVTRLETEEEWHLRLESMKERTLNNLKNAREILLKENERMEKVAKIDEALSKSSFKCEVCGKPYFSHSPRSKSGQTCLQCLSKSQGI